MHCIWLKWSGFLINARFRAEDKTFLFHLYTQHTHNAYCIVHSLFAVIVAEKCRLEQGERMREWLLQNRIHCYTKQQQKNHQAKDGEKTIKIEWDFPFFQPNRIAWGVKIYIDEISVLYCRFKSENLEWKATEIEVDQRNEVKFLASVWLFPRAPSIRCSAV